MNNAEKTQRKGRGSNPNSRKNLKPFQKGQSGNPAGMEVGTKHRSTIVRKWADVRLEIVNPITKDKQWATVEDEVVLSWLREARKGNMAAIKEFLDTLYGKTPDKTELTGADGAEFQVVFKRAKDKE